jgi:ABC-type transport system substrate-binding protein
VRLAYEPAELPDYLDALRAGEVGLFRFGWSAEHAGLDDALRPLLHSEAVPAGADDLDGFNFSRYRDDEVDRLLDEARMLAEEGERRRTYREAELRAVGRDQALVPLFVYRHGSVVSERVEGFRLDPLGHADLSRVRMRADGEAG